MKTEEDMYMYMYVCIIGKSIADTNSDKISGHRRVRGHGHAASVRACNYSNTGCTLYRLSSTPALAWAWPCCMKFHFISFHNYTGRTSIMKANSQACAAKIKVKISRVK